METPALILDIDRLRANAERMLTHCADLGVTLRPHVKTPKSVDVAKLATGGRMSTITTSTLAEAEHFAKAGFKDILYAVGITPNKFARVRRIGPGLMLVVDSVEMAVALAESDLPNPVLIEIDCGEHRGGLHETDPALEQIARALGAQFAGVMSHAGQSYSTDDLAIIQHMATTEADAARRAADRLREGGLEVGIVSIGSTPTVLHADNLDGITELRAGIYLFYDLSQAGRKICGFDDIALTVLSTVIGHNRNAGVLTLDAGALAMSKDIGAQKYLPNAGYGWLCDADTLAPLGLSVDVVHQEHGTVPITDPNVYDQLPIGSMVRILPVHACLTAAGGYGRYHLTDGRVWSRVDGWD
jgi:D-serine deaminase-like pyridoxal phosphate-dependent protein